MKTAVVYARFSCDRQNEQSIDGQLRVCREYAEKNDIVILEVYTDKAVTGTNDDREAFQKMLKDSDKQIWDYVLVYKLDRFSRNKYEMAIHRKHLKDNGISIISVMENIPEGPEGILLESLLEGMNQYYSEELSQKTKRGMNETRLQGNFIGGFVNYGYTRNEKKLVINPDEAEILKLIFNEYANGKNTCDIVRDLNNKGIRIKGKAFQSSTIYHLLNQEKYTGIYRVNGEAFDKIYPPIIDVDVYAIVKKRIDANKHGKHIDNVKYALKGKAFCAYCGKPLASYTGTSSLGEIIRYYKCRSIKEKTICENKAIKKEILENLVNKAMLKVFEDSANLSILIDRIVEIHEKRIIKDSAVNILQAELNNTNKSISNLIIAIEKGIITETTKSRLEELEREKRELQEKVLIAKSKEQLHITAKDISNYFNYSFKQCPQTMIDLLVKHINVYNGKVEIIFNYTKQIEVKEIPQTLFLFTETISYDKRIKGNKTTRIKTKIEVNVAI